MRLDQFTVKAQEALTTAQTEAEKSRPSGGHARSTCYAALVRAGGRRRPGRARQAGRERRPRSAEEISGRSSSLPRTQGAPTHVSPKLDAVLKNAMREAEALKDEYVSTEHLLLALARRQDGGAARS